MSATRPEDPEEARATTGRPGLDVPPLAGWWLIAAGFLVALLFILTDHVLRATSVFAASLVLAAVLRVALPRSRSGGVIVRGPVVDAVTLLVLAGGILLSGFTLDLTAR